MTDNTHPTPTKATATSMRTFSPAPVESDKYRAGLKTELAERIEVDDTTVMNIFIKQNTIPDAVVKRCVSKIRENFHQELQSLEEVEKMAKISGANTEKPKAYEIRMYEPLAKLCEGVVRDTEDWGDNAPHQDLVQTENWVREHLNRTDRPHRKYFVTAKNALYDDAQKLRPKILPDMSVLEGSGAGINISSAFCRQMVSFMEVKPSRTDDPVFNIRRRGKGVKDLAAQTFDYAGIIFASRPFSLFVIGIALYGTAFRVGVYNRVGIVFSEEYSIINDLDVFVRVIRQISCDLTSVGLGQDPTVMLYNGGTYWQDPYPSFKVGMGGSQRPDVPEQRVFLTKGPPLWFSFSFLGRGTSVWQGTYNGEGAILKVAWRSEARKGEADIYQSHAAGVVGVAKLVDGGDVTYPYGKAIPITTQHMLAGAGEDIFYAGTSRKLSLNSVLHRVVVRPVGAMLWTAETDMAWVRALYAAFKGARLTERGVLHRDISAGNVFLWDSEKNNMGPPKGMEGFLADLEFASYPSGSQVNATLVEKNPHEFKPSSSNPLNESAPVRTADGAYLISIPSNKPRHNLATAASHDSKLQGRVEEEKKSQHHRFSLGPVLPKTAPGPVISVRFFLSSWPATSDSRKHQGTAQFMAQEVLVASQSGRDLAREIHHDLESFMLVLIYVAMKRLSKRGQALLDDFERCFPNVGIDAILGSRATMRNETAILSHPSMNMAIGWLVRNAIGLVGFQNPPSNVQSKMEPHKCVHFEVAKERSTPMLMTFEHCERIFLTYFHDEEHQID
ncbi:hypothetical protein DXG03_006456 [Asterophora parasitica]|uniref:Fungal-type protein kinase domain-containing protein n=1 Tax=Asterophora parasitica TaxID=117018 RepID=A0A9P7FYP0_9AGAR|nr:hypothetical protein DXG03_006456 [Asterophora parasitica]